MPSYSFEFDMQTWKGAGVGRVYKSDAWARSAAMKVFANRTSDANDELRVYEGNCQNWFGAEARYIGKVAFCADGETIGWFPPVRESE